MFTYICDQILTISTMLDAILLESVRCHGCLKCCTGLYWGKWTENDCGQWSNGVKPTKNGGIIHGTDAMIINS